MSTMCMVLCNMEQDANKRWSPNLLANSLDVERKNHEWVRTECIETGLWKEPANNKSAKSKDQQKVTPSFLIYWM